MIPPTYTADAARNWHEAFGFLLLFSLIFGGFALRAMQHNEAAKMQLACETDFLEPIREAREVSIADLDAAEQHCRGER